MVPINWLMIIVTSIWASQTLGATEPFMIKGDESPIMSLLPVTSLYDGPVAIDAQAIVNHTGTHLGRPFSGVPTPTNQNTILLNFRVENLLDRALSFVLTNESPIPIEKVYLVTRNAGKVGAVRKGGADFRDEQQPRSSRPSFGLDLPPGITEFFLVAECAANPCIIFPSLREKTAFNAFDRVNEVVLHSAFAATLFLVVFHISVNLFLGSRTYFWGAGVAIAF